MPILLVTMGNISPRFVSAWTRPLELVGRWKGYLKPLLQEQEDVTSLMNTGYGKVYYTR